MYPWRQSLFFVAPAAEVASATVEHGGETEGENKLEFLLRFGTAYWFELNDTISIAPTFMADLVKGDWALVYGLSVGVGW